MNQVIKGKEDQFLKHYGKSFQLKESAEKAGVSVEEGVTFLKKNGVGEKIRKLQTKKAEHKVDLDQFIKKIYHRVFSKNNDALYLLSSEEGLSKKEIKTLDLENVASISYQQGKGYTVSFFDKTKQLEQLYKYLENQQGNMDLQAFYNVLKTSGVTDEE